MGPATESQNKLNAALRYGGTALGTLFTIFGAMQFVTPDQVAQLTQAVHDFNESIISAYGALTKMWIILGPTIVIILAKIGVQSSSVRSIGEKLRAIATGPAGPSAVEAQKAAITVTAAVAADNSIPKSDEAKTVLVEAVKTVASDKIIPLTKVS